MVDPVSGLEIQTKQLASDATQTAKTGLTAWLSMRPYRTLLVGIIIGAAIAWTISIIL